jgi:hypothetical protein
VIFEVMEEKLIQERDENSYHGYRILIKSEDR